MIGYIVLLLFLLLVDSLHYSMKLKLGISTIFIIIFTGIRNGIGYDYLMYVYKIENEWYNTEPISYVFQNIAYLTDPSLFFILSSIFIYGFYSAGIKKGSKDYMGSLFFFIGFPFLYFSSLSTVRQSMALAVIFYLISLGVNCTLKKKLFLILIATLSHYSALIGLLLIVHWQKFSLKFLFSMFLSSFILGKGIKSIVSSIDFDNFLFAKFQLYIENSEQFGGGSITSILLYTITCIILLFSKSLMRYDKRMKYYISLVCLGASLYALFSINPHVAERFSTFFWGASLFIIPTLVKMLKIDRLLYFFLCSILFSISIYVGHITSEQDDKRIESAYFPYRTIFRIQ